jgi:hypothetical protein
MHTHVFAEGAPQIRSVDLGAAESLYTSLPDMSNAKHTMLIMCVCVCVCVRVCVCVCVYV